MATYPNTLTPEEQALKDAEQSGTSGGASSIITPTGATATSGGPTAAPTSPGNFVGLQTYLDANKSQSGQLGKDVAGQIGGSISQAEKDIGGIGTGFQSEANKGTIAGLGTAGQETTDIINKTATGLSDTDKTRFGDIANASYKGPEKLIDTSFYQPAYDSVQKAQKYADLSKTESGSQQLLKDINKGPNYSTGENRLDSYLLKDKGNQGVLAASRAGAGELSGKFSEADVNAAKYAEGVKQKTADIAKAAKTGLESTRSGVSADVEKQLGDISSNWKSEYNKYLDVLKNAGTTGQLSATPEQLKALGLEQGQRIFNILNPGTGATPESFLSQEVFDANKVISKEKQAQLSALDALAAKYGGTATNKYTDASQAGTLNKDASLQVGAIGGAATAAQKAFLEDAKNRNFSKNYNWKDDSGRSDLDRIMGTGISSGESQANVNLADFLNKGESAITRGIQGQGNWGTNSTEAANSLIAQITDYLKSAGYDKGVGVGATNLGSAQTIADVFKPAPQPLGPGLGTAPTSIPGVNAPTIEIPTLPNIGTAPTSIPGVNAPTISTSVPTSSSPTLGIELPNVNLCFVENTLISMEDGSFKAVQDIKLGDMVAFGGMVLGCGVAYNNDIYSHNGVQLTANHMLFEDGKYLRTLNSPNSIKIEAIGLIKVYPIVTENHFLVSNNGVLYSDLMEVNEIGLSDDDRLKILNNKDDIYMKNAMMIELQSEVKYASR